MKFEDFIKKKEFTQQRYEAAKKNANQAKQKGGASELSYQHFNAKLPEYRKIAAEFGRNKDPKWLKSEFNRIKTKLNIDKLSQKEFQKLTGELEVIGEIYIKIRQS